MFTIRLLKKFFRSSYLHLFTSNLLQIASCEIFTWPSLYNVRYEPPGLLNIDHISLLRACTFLSYRLYSSCKSEWADSTALVCAFFFKFGNHLSGPFLHFLEFVIVRLFVNQSKIFSTPGTVIWNAGLSGYGVKVLVDWSGLLSWRQMRSIGSVQMPFQRQRKLGCHQQFWD